MCGIHFLTCPHVHAAKQTTGMRSVESSFDEWQFVVRGEGQFVVRGKVKREQDAAIVKAFRFPIGGR